jgi:hypothetical protein
MLSRFKARAGNCGGWTHMLAGRGICLRDGYFKA